MNRDTKEDIKKGVKGTLSSHEEFGHEATAEISRSTFVGGIPDRQQASLEVIHLGEKGRVIELEEGEVLIGRGPECKIQLPDSNVSRKHARVVFRNEEYHVEDLGSTNGTYVNGIKVLKCVLRRHDQIDIGAVKILFNE